MNPVDKMKELDLILDEYEHKLGLPKQYDNAAFSDIEQYLNMSRDQLEKLSGQDCDEIAYRLMCFSFHLSREYNRENTRVKWADSLMTELAVKEIDQYTGYAFQERLNKAIQGNDYTKKLGEVKRYAEQRSNRIAYLSNNMKNLADTLRNMKRNKEVYHGN